MQLSITNGFYESDALPISAQEFSNWYVNIVQTEGLSQRSLFRTPGIGQVATTGEINQVNRGSGVKNGIPYFVNGPTLYRLDLAVDSNKIVNLKHSSYRVKKLHKVK